MRRRRTQDDNLDSEVDDFTIEEDDHVFTAVVHPVDPHHFVRASSMVSGHLAEAFAKNSEPKGFKGIVPTSPHSYADVFSETAFDSLPEHHKWDHAIELEREPTQIPQSLSVRGHPSIPLLPLFLTMSICISHGLYTYPTTPVPLRPPCDNRCSSSISQYSTILPTSSQPRLMPCNYHRPHRDRVT
jgi:hypothetical protein